MEYEETKNEEPKPWQNSAGMKKKGSAVGSSTVQFLDMPGVTTPSLTKGWESLLKQNMQQENAS